MQRHMCMCIYIHSHMYTFMYMGRHQCGILREVRSFAECRHHEVIASIGEDPQPAGGTLAPDASERAALVGIQFDARWCHARAMGRAQFEARDGFRKIGHVNGIGVHEYDHAQPLVGETKQVGSEAEGAAVVPKDAMGTKRLVHPAGAVSADCRVVGPRGQRDARLLDHTASNGLFETQQIAP